MDDDLTPEQWTALNVYWPPETPKAHRKAYARMMGVCLPDAAKPEISEQERSQMECVEFRGIGKLWFRKP
jgi:hypothetical protein